MGERSRELFLLVVGDIACFVFALYVTLCVRYIAFPSSDLLNAHLGPFFILTGVWLFIFYIAGLYDKHTTFLKGVLLNRIIHTQVMNVFVAALLFLIIPFGIAPKTNLAIYLVVSILLITFWRLRLFNVLSPKNRHKAILIADGAEALALVDEVNNNDRYNYSFVRVIDSQTIQNTTEFESKLLTLIETEKISMIVANARGEHIDRILPILFDLAFLKFVFTFIDFNKIYEDTFDKIPLSSLHYDWFINHLTQSVSLVYDFVKRATDIVGALVLLVPCIVIFPFIALVIKAQDRGPVFYRTQRTGQFNKPIEILKFRSMTGMDSGEAALATQHEVTPFGKFLRKSRLDELPQLVNVLRGDLSFIGPRPEMPALAQVYAEKIPYYNTRHFIKPGLSGWAQINDYNAPRGGVDIERTTAKLSLDLYYLKHRSLFLDLKIALKTLNTLIMRTGT